MITFILYEQRMSPMAARCFGEDDQQIKSCDEKCPAGRVSAFLSDVIPGSIIEFLETYAAWIAVLSLFSIVVASVLTTWFVAGLPVDYFTYQQRHRRAQNHWVVRLVLAGIKNLVGLLMIAAGIIMLFTPGQGLLTLLAGILLTDFPGKFRLERWLASRKNIMSTLNWLRSRHGKPPFEPPD